ncbi:MAG: ABC transporter permease [Acidobacteriota bacterium]|jgi:predicted permease
MRARGFRRAFGWLRRDTSRAVDDELRSHLDMKAEELIAAGVPAEEAQRRARESFGDLGAIRRESLRIQAQVDRRRSLRDLLDGVLQDARYALRALRRNPGFSIVAILTLALGIGANTAIFGVVNGIMLRTLSGVERPDRLVEVAQGDGDDFVSVSYPVFDRVRRTSRTLQDLAAFDVVSMTFSTGGPAEVVFGLQVTGNYFDVLGARPQAGRFFAAGRWFPPDVEDAVVISDSLWRRRFGASEDVVGRSISVSGHPARIVGVAPAGFGGHVVAVQADVFVPLGMGAPGVHTAAALAGVRNGVLETIGRMADGATIEQVRAEVAALAEGLVREQEGPDAVYPLQTTPYSAVPGTVRAGAGLFFAALMVIVGLLLLISCVNVANMLLARAGTRRKEIAVRLSVGAGRGRLVRQMMTESLLLAGIGAIAGVLAATWLAGLLTALEPPVLPFPGMRLQLDFGLDAHVLLYAMAVTGLTTVAFGLVPALRATRPEMTASLKDGGTGAAQRSRGRGVTVAAQMAITVVLLLAAGLFLRALRAAQFVDTGFRADSVYVAGFDLSLNGYDAPRVQRFYDDLLARAGALPGVGGVAVAGKLPLAGASSTTIEVPGAQGSAEAEQYGYSLHNQSVSANYFGVLGLPLLRGRALAPSDRADAPLVAVVNETMATRFWTVGTAVGQRFVMFGDREVAVVGVVADAKYHGLVEDPPLFAYFSFRQRPRTDMVLHLEAGDGAEVSAMWSALRDLVADIDPDVPLLSAASLDDALSIYRLPQVLAAWITAVAGFLGLTLGTVGIYGVTAYAASRRRHEIGVRVALGAAAGDVRRMMMVQGMRAPLLGIAAGLLFAVWAAQLLGSFLVGVSPRDPLTFVVVAAVLAAAAALAALIPALRSARIDPVVTLKAD